MYFVTFPIDNLLNLLANSLQLTQIQQKQLTSGCRGNALTRVSHSLIFLFAIFKKIHKRLRRIAIDTQC